MKRPNKKDYITNNQFTYVEDLHKYYEDQEKYIDFLEDKVNKLESIIIKHKVIERFCNKLN